MAIALQRWPIVGRRPELEVFEQTLASGVLTGLVIHGRAGTGKTRLADECREQAAAGGHPTERVAGSRTAALLPLGAVAPLLSGGLGGQLSTVALFEQTRQALHTRHHGSRLVIVADDVALLDAASVALLGYLAAQGAIFLVATVRTGEPVPDLLAGLWRDGRLARVDLQDLSRTQVDTLLHLALGGPIEAGAGRELWEITRGNPLYIRELVLGALESGALVERSGVWHLEDRLPDTTRLLDLVEQRIGGLTEQARSVIELLALCEPVELSYLDATVPADVLESLERAGLVTIAVADDQVSLAHPLHGKVVRAAMPRLRSRSILLAQASRLESQYQPPRPAAALRIATWRLDAGGRPDPDILLRGAHLARHAHDFRVIRRLIEAVPAAQLDAAGSLLLGEALYELGEFETADRVLEQGQRLAGDEQAADEQAGAEQVGNEQAGGEQAGGEQVALHLAIMRGKNAQWGLCRPGSARDINAAARKVIVSPAATEELIADEACVLTFSGHPDQALAVLSGIAGGSRRTGVVRAIAAAPALALTGQTAQALTVAELGYAEHAALGAELAIAHPAMHLVNQVFALTEAGRLAEAEQLALAGADIVAANRVPVAQIFFAVNLGRVATLQGRLAAGRRYYAEAAGLAQASRFAGPLRLALSGLALACAMLGDPAGARKALGEREGLPPFGFRGPEQDLADAWAELVMRRPADAASRFRDAAGRAAATGHLTIESWLLHDLLRATGQDASARLGEIAAACDSPLVTARARHARAARAQDAGELAAAAADFESLGAMLLAAEACAGAAEAYTRAGDRRSAAQVLRRASLLAAVCEGAATPGLVQIAGAVPLSGREREIVMLAASGLASKDIAGRLYLSVRTVNNHLQHAYAKLGVSSRAGLAEALRSGS